MPKPSLYHSLGSPFTELISVDSTNNYALSQLHAGLTQHGEAFFAHEQRAGKGQRGKIWIAPKESSIILSVVINPYPLQLVQQFQLSACIAVSVFEFFESYAGNHCKIKWPNDLYWCDRKAGGILIENIIGKASEIHGGQKSRDNILTPGEDRNTIIDNSISCWLWAVAGIGININQTNFPNQLINPVSLAQITGKKYAPLQLGRELCVLMDKNFKKLIENGFEEIYNTYQLHLYKKNEPVKFKKGNRVFEALVRCVSPSGELVIQHALEESFRFGEIEWVIAPDTP